MAEEKEKDFREIRIDFRESEEEEELKKKKKKKDQQEEELVLFLENTVNSALPKTASLPLPPRAGSLTQFDLNSDGKISTDELSNMGADARIQWLARSEKTRGDRGSSETSETKREYRSSAAESTESTDLETKRELAKGKLPKVSRIELG